MDYGRLIEVANDLEHAGLLWSPEIGDEVSQKDSPSKISVLVDPHGMGPSELRSVYLWLPTVEQLVLQFEARQAVLFHAGLELSDSVMNYKTVIQSKLGSIEHAAESLRTAMALSLRDLLLADSDAVH